MSMPSHPPPLRLLDQLRQQIRTLHYSIRTEQAYVYWVRAFVRFHDLRHPADLGGDAVHAFLTWLAAEQQVSVSTHKQALSALLFLYQKVLRLNVPWLDEVSRPQRAPRLPVVLSHDEVAQVLRCLARCAAPVRPSAVWHRHAPAGRPAPAHQGHRFRAPRHHRPRGQGRQRPRGDAARLAGCRPCARSWLLPMRCGPLTVQPVSPGVQLPHALDRKYPRAALSWAWFWVFPQAALVGGSARAGAPAGTTSMSRPSSVPSSARCRPLACTSRPRRTPCAIPSPPICCWPATTSAPCKSCWATPMSAPPWSTPMCSSSVVVRCAARSTTWPASGWRPAQLWRRSYRRLQPRCNPICSAVCVAICSATTICSATVTLAATAATISVLACRPLPAATAGPRACRRLHPWPCCPPTPNCTAAAASAS